MVLVCVAGFGSFVLGAAAGSATVGVAVVVAAVVVGATVMRASAAWVTALVGGEGWF